MRKMISNIVFTKNRPLQLDAYLESLYRYFPLEIIQTHIIYKEELFSEQYDTLFQKFPGCLVVRERDFHSDFLKLLDRINTKFILFGIDDVVYFDSVDFRVIDETFNKFPNDIFGFSLRFSKQNAGEKDVINEHSVAGQTVYSLNWKQGQTSITRYPFELCATVYSTELVKKVINSTMSSNAVIKSLFAPSSFLIMALGKIKSPRSVLKSFGYFYSPNTLESWNCRWCQNHRDQLPGLIFFQKLCASAIQVNMVNTTTSNMSEDSPEHTVETLNEKYKNGFRLDIDFIRRNKPTGTHSGSECFRLFRI